MQTDLLQFLADLLRQEGLVKFKLCFGHALIGAPKEGFYVGDVILFGFDRYLLDSRIFIALSVVLESFEYGSDIVLNRPYIGDLQYKYSHHIVENCVSDSGCILLLILRQICLS